MAAIREVPIHRTTSLELYRDLDHFEPLVHELVHLGRQVSGKLGMRSVWMLNSTATGGGVAEMLPREASLLADLGVDTRWLVLDPEDPEFFPVTKALHNMIHGEPGLADTEKARAIYERVSCAAVPHLRHIDRNDVLVVHDPQPAAIPLHIRAELRPRLIWRCHIGVPEENEHTEAGWAFLRPYLAPYERLLFSAWAYVPDELVERSGELHPGIDPLAHKNRTLRPYKLVGILRSAGLVDGPEVPAWARFCAQVQRHTDDGWVERPIADLLHVPVILQVSRFDRLKGFHHLIPAFAELLRTCPARAPHLHADAARVQSEVSRAMLVLAGPDPAGVQDDPEAADVLAELCAQQMALPRELRERIHLLRLPMADVKENALIVNCLQRIASVAVQASVREGFGLTAAESLWKGTPVVASNVGGLAVQIRDGTDGILVQHPEDSQELSGALLRMLASPLDAERMARSGRRRVREHFFVLAKVQRWLAELDRLLEQPRP